MMKTALYRIVVLFCKGTIQVNFTPLF